MTDQERQVLRMLGRVDKFGDRHMGEFRPQAPARGDFAVVKQVVLNLRDVARDQQTGDQSREGGTAGKVAAEATLRARMKPLVKTGRIIFDDDDEKEAKFRMPRSSADEALLAAARAMRDLIEPEQAQFLDFEMPADFFSQFEDAIEAWRVAIGAPQEGIVARSGATKQLDEEMKTGLKAVRRLDVSVPNKYSANARILAEWHTASDLQNPAEPDAPTPPAP